MRMGLLNQKAVPFSLFYSGVSQKIMKNYSCLS